MVALGECGRYPLFIDYYMYCIKYWCRLLEMPNSRYPRNCYLMLKSLDDVGRKNWATSVKNLLFLYGFGNVWISQEVGNANQFIRCFKQRLIDCFKQNWHGNINESGRCFHYKHYKSLLNTEQYLLIDMPLNHKTALAKFRCSNHKFSIETGRHSKITREKRICLYCLQKFNQNIIECEYHVFFQCEKFHEIRQHFLFTWYKSYTNITCFYSLLQSDNPVLIRKLAHYVHMLLKEF